MGIRIHTTKTSQIAREAVKLISAIATFKFERGCEITRAQLNALVQAEKALDEIIHTK